MSVESVWARAIGEGSARSIVRERKAARLSPRAESKTFAEQILERDHIFEHSIRVHGSIRSWYLQLEYDIIEVPVDEPNARVEFILECVTSA